MKRPVFAAGELYIFPSVPCLNVLLNNLLHYLCRENNGKYTIYSF